MGVDIARIESARKTVARIAIEDETVAPLFWRLDQEIENRTAKTETDLLKAARKIAAQG